MDALDAMCIHEVRLADKSANRTSGSREPCWPKNDARMISDNGNYQALTATMTSGCAVTQDLTARIARAARLCTSNPVIGFAFADVKMQNRLRV